MQDYLAVIANTVDTGNDETIDEVATPKVIKWLMGCIQSQDISLFVPAFRALGNILSTNNSQIVE